MTTIEIRLAAIERRLDELEENAVSSEEYNRRCDENMEQFRQRRAAREAAESKCFVSSKNPIPGDR